MFIALMHIVLPMDCGRGRPFQKLGHEQPETGPGVGPEQPMAKLGVRPEQPRVRPEVELGRPKAKPGIEPCPSKILIVMYELGIWYVQCILNERKYFK